MAGREKNDGQPQTGCKARDDGDLMARPKLPDDRRREQRLQVRLSVHERVTLEYVAERYGISVSTFMRDMAMAVAEDCICDNEESPNSDSKQ